MGTTASGVWYLDPNGSIDPIESVFSTMASSIENAFGTGYVRTAIATSVTDRNAQATAYGPTNSRPFMVWRTDATAGRNIEFTTDGTNWSIIQNTRTAMGKVTATIASGQKDSPVVNLTFPSGLFSSVPSLQATCVASGAVWATTGSITTSSAAIRIHSAAAVSGAYTADVHWTATLT